MTRKLKLSKKQKEYEKRYDRIIKISAELLELRFGGTKDTKCTRCNKKVLVSDCIDCKKKQTKAFTSMKGVSYHESELPFGLIPRIFNSVKPFVVCRKCRDDIYRYMGKIPDIQDHDAFPQHYHTYDTVDDFSKKKSKSEIMYRKNKYPYSAKKLAQLQKRAVTSYIFKYPDVKYSQAQLLAIVKSSKKSEKVVVYK